MPVVRKTKHGDWEGIVHFPVWAEYKVHIVLGESIEKSYAARFGKDDDVTDGAAALHRGAGLAGHDGYIFLSYKSDPGQIAHESYHAVRYMIQDWAHGETTNEVVAYHLGHLVDRIHQLKSIVMEAPNEHKATRREAARLPDLHPRATEEGTPGKETETGDDPRIGSTSRCLTGNRGR